jgi:hypothetical protein
MRVNCSKAAELSAKNSLIGSLVTLHGLDFYVLSEIVSKKAEKLVFCNRLIRSKMEDKRFFSKLTEIIFFNNFKAEFPELVRRDSVPDVIGVTRYDGIIRLLKKPFQEPSLFKRTGADDGTS